jgi:hypothetical protein
MKIRKKKKKKEEEAINKQLNKYATGENASFENRSKPNHHHAQ